MGIWSRLFGDGDRKPEGERPGALRDGKKHGAWIEKDGSFLVERVYRDGVIHGPLREWHPDGWLSTKVDYIEGVREGVLRQFRKDASLATEATYWAGRLHGAFRTYHPDGSLQFEQEFRDDKIYAGPCELEHKGHLIYRGRYERGVKVGPWEEYHHGGRVKERGTFVDGKQHGRFELGEEYGTSWEGDFDMGERVGVWRMRRADGSVAAEGEYPRGAEAQWQVFGRNGATCVRVPVRTADSLPRWIALAERWLANRPIAEFGAWPTAERATARAWIASRTVDAPGESPDAGRPGTADEIRDRDLLVDEIGEVTLPARGITAAPEDEDDEVWQTPRRLRGIEVGTLDLAARGIVDSPEVLDVRNACSFRPGAYRVVGFEVPDDRLWMPAAVLRLPGVPVVRWSFLIASDDDNLVILPDEADPSDLEFPGYPPEGQGARLWLVFGQTCDGKRMLWISNPTGNSMRAYGGLDAEGKIAAVFVQLD